MECCKQKGVACFECFRMHSRYVKLLLLYILLAVETHNPLSKPSSPAILYALQTQRATVPAKVKSFVTDRNYASSLPKKSLSFPKNICTL